MYSKPRRDHQQLSAEHHTCKAECIECHNCLFVNYNNAEKICILGKCACIRLEPDAQSSIAFFGTKFELCLKWIPSATHRHYIDVIMSTMTSQITSLRIVYSTVYSGADQRKHQSSASLAFVPGINRWPVNSLHKGPVTRIMFPFDDVIMQWNDGMWWRIMQLTCWPSIERFPFAAWRRVYRNVVYHAEWNRVYSTSNGTSGCHVRVSNCMGAVHSRRWTSEPSCCRGILSSKDGVPLYIIKRAFGND